MNAKVVLDWNKHPLIPAIAQDHETHEVLMLAYMNQEAYNLTLSTGFAHYFSRSKQRIWKKGESSNHTQEIKDVLIDCDGDTIVLKIHQNGVACHTGAKSCFFTSVNKENILYNSTLDTIAIYGIVDTLYHTILSRKNDNSSNSWTKKLLNDKQLLLSKIREEADELAVAIDEEEDKQVVYEASDLLYHALVGLAYRDVSPDRIKQELARRFGTSGIQEKATRS